MPNSASLAVVSAFGTISIRSDTAFEAFVSGSALAGQIAGTPLCPGRGQLRLHEQDFLRSAVEQDGKRIVVEGNRFSDGQLVSIVSKSRTRSPLHSDTHMPLVEPTNISRTVMIYMFVNHLDVLLFSA
jgi:hypothetical protein